MAAVCDPTTIEILKGLGVAVGWRCLEVGAGGGSVAAWLADRVTGESDGEPAGHLVATDIDTRHLTALAGPRLTVLDHDVTRHPAPAGGRFDLIHTRFVLEHLPDRDQVLDRLVGWLKPGGLLVVESIAGFPVASSPHPLFRQAMLAVDQVLAATIGTDSTWARGFPTPLLDRNLTDVGATVHLPTTGGANASTRCWALTLAALRPHLLDRRIMTGEALDAALGLLDDPTFFDLAFATAICWGRAPA